MVSRWRERLRVDVRPFRRRTVQPRSVLGTGVVVTCRTAREAISALLDGEESPVTEDLLATHVSACASCESFHARAATLSRRLRVRAFEPAPSREDEILSALGIAAATSPMRWPQPPRRVMRWRASGVSATQWAAAVVPLGVAVPALALGAFAHVHIVASHVATPCTSSLFLHLMRH